MKITSEKIEVSEDKTIYWEEVKTLRLINDTLALVMKDGSVVEIPHIRPTTIDLAFRSYENFLMRHPKHQ